MPDDYHPADDLVLLHDADLLFPGADAPMILDADAQTITHANAPMTPDVASR